MEEQENPLDACYKSINEENKRLKNQLESFNMLYTYIKNKFEFTNNCESGIGIGNSLELTRGERTILNHDTFDEEANEK